MSYKPYRIKAFTGLDNVNEKGELVDISKGKAGLSEATNVDFSATNRMSRRRGFTQALDGEWHSLFGCPDGDYGVCDGILCRLGGDPLEKESLCRVGLLLFTYADAGAAIYCSNNELVWKIIGATVTELAHIGSYDPSREHLDGDNVFDAPPPAKYLLWAFGRLWSVTEEGLFYSQPYKPERFNLEKDFIELPGVTGVAEVDTGLFIGTSKGVFYLEGGNPNIPMRTVKGSNAGCAAGSMIQASADDFEFEDIAGKVAVWESNKGKVVGINGGGIIYLSKGRVEYNIDGMTAASFIRDINGQRHHVSTLAEKSGGEGSNMRTTDIAVAEVWRNGVLI